MLDVMETVMKEISGARKGLGGTSFRETGHKSARGSGIYAKKTERAAFQLRVLYPGKLRVLLPSTGQFLGLPGAHTCGFSRGKAHTLLHL